MVPPAPRESLLPEKILAGRPPSICGGVPCPLLEILKLPLLTFKGVVVLLNHGACVQRSVVEAAGSRVVA